MESKVKFAGHPVHPMLIVFPLGLLSTAVIFDILYLFSNKAQWTEVAYYMIGAGVIGGLFAAIFGWLDWSAIPPPDPRQAHRPVPRRGQCAGAHPFRSQLDSAAGESRGTPD